MAISGRLVADFDSFFTAVTTAQTHLRSFEQSAGTVGSALNEIADGFNSQKVIDQSSLMEQAVARAGSASGGTAEKVRDLGKATGEVEEPTTKADRSFGSLTASFIKAEAIIETAKAAFNAYTGFISSSVDSFIAAEQAQARLTGALRAQGQATPEVIAQYAALSEQFARTTTFSGDLLVEMQALLTQVGNVAPGQMRAALTAATDLAAGLGIDLQGATNALAKAMDGNVGGLKRYGIQIDETALKTRGADAVFEAIQQRFGGQAQAQLETYGGRVSQLGNNWDNLKEKVGGLVAQDPQLQTMLAVANSLLGEMTDETGKTSGAVNTLWNSWETYIRTGQQIAPGAREITQAMTVLGYILVDVGDKTNRAEESWKRYLERIDANKISMLDLTNNTREYNRVQDELTAGAQKLIDEGLKRQKDAEDRLFGRDLIQRANEYAATLGDVSNVTKLTEGNKKMLKTAVDAALEAYAALGQTAPDALLKIAAATTPLLESTTRLANTFVPLKEGISDSSQEVREAIDAFTVYRSDVVFTSQVIETEMIPAVDAMTKEIEESTARLLSWSEAMAEVARGQGTLTASAPMLDLADFDARYWELFETLMRLGYTPGEAEAKLRADRAKIVAAQPRAMGGPVSEGSSYVVGEQGPELFIPRSAGTIFPSSSVGSTNVITVNTMMGDSREVARAVEQAILDAERRQGRRLPPRT